MFHFNFLTKILSLLLLFLIGGLTLIVIAESKPDRLMLKAQKLFEPIPEALELEHNPITPEKVELGKMLWFDPRLSSSGLISCNTCHNLGLVGIDLQQTSIGHGWQKGPRNTPTVFNTGFHVAQFWDGRAEDLFEQAQFPIQGGSEMNSTLERAAEVVNSIPEYKEHFSEIFSEDQITFESMAKALEAFEVTLITPNSRFDQYLLGDERALNKEEKEGLELFIDKNCVSCHNGVAIGGSSYQRFGIVQDPNETIRPPEDLGRAKITGEESDEYVFKSPSLRNVALTGPYFHSGAVDSLDEAVRIIAETQSGVTLTDEETSKIVVFLGTLTGENPVVTYPILPASTEATPRPQPYVNLDSSE